MQLLWTSNRSNVSRLEESSLYGSQLDEVIIVFNAALHIILFLSTNWAQNYHSSILYVVQKSCVEHLCDSLCYHLDLASFVACVNSGKSWSSKSSLLLSGQHVVPLSQDMQSDPFVENFILERLSVQSALRVRPLSKLFWQTLVGFLAIKPAWVPWLIIITTRRIPAQCVVLIHICFNFSLL